MKKSDKYKAYDALEIEKRWIEEWNREDIYNLKTNKKDPKYYMLEMFPYPSGEPHMGHARNYTIGDVVARVMNRRGHNVLHPIGFDSFGLPAENAAIKNGIHPRESTLANIDKMRTALKRMGMAYDFSDEIITSEPDYYKWTQWLFLLFYKMGLAEKKEAPVNWCQSCQTVLANEQVIGGVCERCDNRVIKKVLSQWFFKITRYAQRLLDDMDTIKDGWPERVLAIQRNWIGRSEGAIVNFKLEKTGKEIPVFTTRPDTLFGVTFFILAPEHGLVEEVTASECRQKVDQVKQIILKQTDIERGAAETEKVGCFTGSYAVNPLTGEKVPIWIANYVLLEYGTGAIMAVPGHDERDFDFAKKYRIPIKQVISPDGTPRQDLDSAYQSEGIMVNSGRFTGMPSGEGKKKITEHLAEKGIGKFEINYKLKDWLISRQRYWGAPIPIVYCQKCGTVPVPEDSLPVKLPYDVDFKPTGLSPLAYSPSFVNTSCPTCGGEAKRETDTMDTFLCSSWYFLRYCSPHDEREAFQRGEADYWMPVDQYIGGIEHATMHLIYARFFTKVLYDARLIGFKEPFSRYFPHGVVNLGGKRMSKSRGNLVSPAEVYNRYGSDTLRLYMLFMGPADAAVDWSEAGVEGANRFLSRIWRLAQERMKGSVSKEGFTGAGLEGAEKEAYKKLHQTIKKVNGDIFDRFNFNTAISALMELVNLMYKREKEISDQLFSNIMEKLLIMLSPISPFITEELWHLMGNSGSIHRVPWPDYDVEAAKEDRVTFVFQVNGKVRDKAELPAGLTKEELERTALGSENVQRFIGGKKILKSIMVPNKLINFVVK